MAMNRVRVLLVDDHPLFRRGVRWALESHPTIEVVGEAGDGETALQQVELLHPNVVLCDLNLPGMSGLDVTRLLKDRHPRIAVVILTLHQDDEQRDAALQAGASAYASKETAGTELASLLERVARGDYVIEASPSSRRAPDPFDERGTPAPLSPRELDVLTSIAQGNSNKEISRLLAISDQTVKNHVTAILRKLDVSDRTQAVLHALRRGWIKLDRDAQGEGWGSGVAAPNDGTGRGVTS
jgi:DNA-binding NarL/FixJ family response regulator